MRYLIFFRHFDNYEIVGAYDNLWESIRVFRHYIHQVNDKSTQGIILFDTEIYSIEQYFGRNGLKLKFIKSYLNMSLNRYNNTQRKLRKLYNN